ncbi:hypothetical protein EXS72_01325 [Candidatus Pacearchaeota archaeon]|nr:hypothetical protein [Candidatus Pacearchaeota archaeon]
MLPRWHIFWGLIFSVIFKILVPQTTYISVFLIWFASVFIDFDHYLSAGIKTKNWRIKHSLKYNYEKRNQIMTIKKTKDLCEKGDFHIFHTFESHIFIGILSIFFAPLFFIFIGMILHSTLDVIWMVNHDLLKAREFFFFKHLRNIFF